MPAERAGTPRVAYLITSHALPHQVLRLARTLRAGSPGAPVVIHHDEQRSRLDEAALRALGGVELVRPPVAVSWGGGSQLDMLLRCFEWLVDRVEFDWMVTLSGQDYPIRPLAAIEHDLATGGYDGYVEGAPVEPPPWTRARVDEFTSRYFYRHRPIRRPQARVRRAVAAARPLLVMREMPWGVLLGRRCRVPFSRTFPCRRGSDWLSLSRHAVEAVVRAARSRPGLVRHYRRTVLPTESFPQTVLHATPGLRLSTTTRRFTSWAEGSLHPDVLRLADLERIVTSGADFARKFDAGVDGAVMDELDALVAA